MATPTNLPAAQTTGNVLTAAYVNDLRGAFRILQVKSFSTSSVATNSTLTFAATGLTLSITPQSTSSKILIMTNHSIAKSAGNALNGLDIRIRRDGTVLQTQFYVLFTATTLVQIGTTSFFILDSPNTTSAITYDAQFANVVAAAQVEHNANNSPSNIILMEVSA
jgi:hypothetical protein